MKLKQLFKAPTFPDDEVKTNIAKHLNITSWLALILLTIYRILLPIVAPYLATRANIVLFAIALQIGVLFGLRKGWVNFSSTVSLSGFWLLFAFSAVISGGIRSTPYSGNLLVILTAAIQLGWRAAIVFAVLSVAQGFGLVWAEMNELLPPLATTPQSALLLQAINYIVGGSTLHFATFSIKEALSRARIELMERQHVEKALAQNAADLRALYEASLVLNAQHNSPALLEIIVEQAVNFSGLHQSNLYLLHPDQRLENVAHYNMPDEYLGAYMHLGEGMVGDVAQTGRPLVIEDYQNWEGRIEKFAATGARRVLSLPLRIQNQITGVLSVADTEQAGPFTDGEIHSLSLFADQAAIAIENAQLFTAARQELEERKRIEQALRASEARFRALTENATDMILILDAEGVIKYASPSVQRIMGYAPDELTGQSVFTLLHPEDAARMSAAWLYLLEQMVTHTDTTLARIRHADGTWHIHEGLGRNLLGEPAIAGFVLNTRDITERKQAEEAIRVSQQRLSVLIERSPLAVIEWDLDFRVNAWNPAAEQLYGYRAEEVIGCYAAEIMAPEVVRNQIPDYFEQLEQQKRDILAQKGDQHRIITNYTKDGRPFICEWFYTLLVDARGDPFGVATIGMDITERKHLEAEREKLIAELETRNAELERFLYTISHDLRSPLITMGGFVGFLERDALSGHVERVKADTAHISDALAKMRQLLDELLELSRIGRVVNPPEALPFDAIVREAIETVRGRIEARGVQVEIALDLPVVYGDRARLIEVVQNLVDNACKFMGEQPHPQIEIGTRQVDSKTVFYVRDNGIGIEPRYHEQIFGLFDKLDPTSEGIGIGLALVKRIVEIHGGRIWIESAVGAGSTFYFTLAQI